MLECTYGSGTGVHVFDSTLITCVRAVNTTKDKDHLKTILDVGHLFKNYANLVLTDATNCETLRASAVTASYRQCW